MENLDAGNYCKIQKFYHKLKPISKITIKIY